MNNNHTGCTEVFTGESRFAYCGIAKAEVLDDDARRLESWLNKGMNGTMQYMENHFDMRIDPSRLVPGGKISDHVADELFSGGATKTGQPACPKYAYGRIIMKSLRPG